LERLTFSVIRQKAFAIRFDQKVNYINVETAIRRRRKTAGKKDDATG